MGGKILFSPPPWEIARPADGQEPLLERNLVVRMETGASPAYAPPPPGPDEPLRVLLVFAEAPGSRPLAMRLESCLAVDRDAEDLRGQAADLSALASLWAERKDREQAAGLERKALEVRNRLSDLADRSGSHGNLALYLGRLGAVEEAAQHELAVIAYVLVIGHGQLLATALHNLAIYMHRAAASGGRYELPPLAELLARPEFEPLQRTLAEWKVGLDELQAKIDEQVEEVRRRVETEG